MRYLSLVGPLQGLFVPVPDGTTQADLRRSMLRDLAGTIYTAEQAKATVAANLNVPCIILPDYYAARLFEGGALPPLVSARGGGRIEEYRTSHIGDGPAEVA